MRNMRRASGPKPMDPPLRPPPVRPRGTFARDVRAGEVRVAVSYEVVRGGFAGAHGEDTLRGDLAEEFGDVAELGFDAVGDCACCS